MSGKVGDGLETMHDRTSFCQISFRQISVADHLFADHHCKDHTCHLQRSARKNSIARRWLPRSYPEFLILRFANMYADSDSPDVILLPEQSLRRRMPSSKPPGRHWIED